EAADQIQQRRLAGARGPHQRQEVSLADLEIELVQHMHDLDAALVVFREAADADEHTLHRWFLWFSISRRSSRAEIDNLSLRRAAHSAGACTAAPSDSSATGVATTTSPASMPASTSTAPARSAPTRTATRSTRSPRTRQTKLVPPSRAIALAGTRVAGRAGGPPELVLGSSLPLESRNVTLTPMFERIRGSSSSKPMRTFTVAFWRSAVGTMLMTWLGMTQSGYASSTASVFCPARTRLMNDSLTSTSISRELMSISVAMPVRVKPPPAEIGETISPGCAFFETMTPANGARTSRSSIACALTRTVACATSTARSS